MISGDRFFTPSFFHWERGTDIDTKSTHANDPFHFSLKTSVSNILIVFVKHYSLGLNHTSNQDLFHEGCVAIPNGTNMAQEELEEREEVEVEGGAKCPCFWNGHGWGCGEGTIGALSGVEKVV